MRQCCIPPQAITDWFPELLHVPQKTNRGLRTIAIELRHALDLDGVHPRLRSGVRPLRSARHEMKVGLSGLDMLAKWVLHECAGAKPATSAPALGR